LFFLELFFVGLLLFGIYFAGMIRWFCRNLFLLLKLSLRWFRKLVWMFLGILVGCLVVGISLGCLANPNFLRVDLLIGLKTSKRLVVFWSIIFLKNFLFFLIFIFFFVFDLILLQQIQNFVRFLLGSINLLLIFLWNLFWFLNFRFLSHCFFLKNLIILLLSL
jgi:hypothetical protein